MVELEKNDAGQPSPWLWGLLLITLALTAWVAMQEEDALAVEDDVVVQHERTPRKTRIKPRQKQQDTLTTANTETNNPVRQSASGLIDWQQLDRSAMAQPKNLFRSKNWVPARKTLREKVVKVAPPPAPKAPPIPFEYMGRLENGPEGNLVYLATSDKSYSAIIGRNVNSFWRLDKEDANQLHFTYLPLGLPQTLSKKQGANTVASGTKPAFGNAF